MGTGKAERQQLRWPKDQRVWTQEVAPTGLSCLRPAGWTVL